MYDLAGFYVPTEVVAEVVSIQGIQDGRGRAYEVTVRFSKSVAGGRPAGGPIVVTATWAVEQRARRWLLANVLPRRTAGWRRESVGQIHYFVEPTLSFNRAKAVAAVQFIDSLTTAFGVSRLGPLDYYVAPTVDAALNALGVEYPTTFGPGGGFAKPMNDQLFAAVPAWGENYRHELTHLVLRPLLAPPAITIIGSEGIATWFGGTAGMGFGESVRNLRSYLSSDPKVTLDSATTQGHIPQAETYASGAVLCDMLYQRGGNAALKAFLVAGPGPEQLRTELVRLLGQSWAEVSANWRAAVDRVAGPARPT